MPENACFVEIYRNSEDYNRHHCRVIAGVSDITYSSLFFMEDVTFTKTRALYDIPLNGPGKNKALKKVRQRLASDGLRLKILECSVLEESAKS